VLIHEGIIADTFEYDYAPQSILVENRKIWVNTSYEGQSDVEYLREQELVHGLQVSSRSYKPVVCYQLSEKGKALVGRIPLMDKEAVHDFAYKEASRELLTPMWNGSEYWLHGTFSGFRRRSAITDTEDVSYVASAYIPQCLRYGGRPTMSNAHRAHESGMGALDNIRDKDLDVVITLNSVSIIVAEYIPFGANQMVQLNNNVGSTERVQGGFISPLIDEDDTATSLVVSPNLTSIEILDYTITNHMNCEAEIRIPEDPGIIQVETFGISLNAEGTCFYGMQIEAVMGRIRDNVSLDHLARILVDVQQDSSTIVDSIISQFQRDLLNNIFLGDASNRNKVNLIIANEITPHLTAEEYMDKSDYENELQQVIGDTKAAYDISENDTLVFGAHGLLVVGPNSRRYEPLLCAYLQYITIDIFLQNYFARLWILNDFLSNIDARIDIIDLNPSVLQDVRIDICRLSKEIIQLDEILGYLLEALEIMEIPPEPKEQTGRSLYDRLEISGMRSQMVRRTTDLRKNIVSSQRLLKILRERTDVATETKKFRLNNYIKNDLQHLCLLQKANKESSYSLQILQILFSGMFAFQFLDRITGDWTVLDSSWMKHFVKYFIQRNMFLWFFFSLLAWALTAAGITKIYNVLNWKYDGRTSVQVSLNQSIDLHAIQKYIGGKVKLREERRYDDKGQQTIVKVTYTEQERNNWGGTEPIIDLEYMFDQERKGLTYDEKDDPVAFLLSLSIRYKWRNAKRDLAFNSEELKEKVLMELKDSGVVTKYPFSKDSDEDSRSLSQQSHTGNHGSNLTTPYDKAKD